MYLEFDAKYASVEVIDNKDLKLQTTRGVVKLKNFNTIKEDVYELITPRDNPLVIDKKRQSQLF